MGSAMIERPPYNCTLVKIDQYLIIYLLSDDTECRILAQADLGLFWNCHS